MNPAARLLTHARYQPLEILGRGGQGVVLRVADREAPGRALVAKVWLAGLFDEPALLGEFALLARARVPGLVRAHDLGRDAATGAPFLVEDFVGGPEGGAWVQGAAGAERGGRLLQLLADVAGTLALLHGSGFVHGDLKPAHVRLGLTAPPRAFLLDLGAAVSRARAAEAPHAFTPAFAAPEVAAGAPPSPRADLYGLGAVGWTAATSVAPEPGRGKRRPLRQLAPWVEPAAADLIEALLAPHPGDRPADAREVLRQLGVAHRATGAALVPPPAPVGREAELGRLLGQPAAAVRYVVGPSGAGKSHLARELLTRALLEGRSARLVAFPSDDAQVVARLVAFFRGSDFALPFVDDRLLLVLDDLQHAPAELAAALDAYRCRSAPGARVEVVATARAAPDGAEVVALGPLDPSSFAELCHLLGVRGEAEVREQAAASGGNPGWLVAAIGCVPLTRDTALDRGKSLSEGARGLLGSLAALGGSASDALCRRLAEPTGAPPAPLRERAGAATPGPLADRAGAATPGPLAELLAAALVTRRAAAGGALYALSAPALAPELAAALASFDRVDRAADLLLAEPDPPSASLLALAGAPAPPARRAALLERAAGCARAEGLRSEEIDALFALAADARLRTPALLCRLERLTRDAGVQAAHPQVLGWLDEAAAADRATLPLALRRRAEKLAREGDAAGARALAEQARSEAHALADPAGEALARSTAGLVALFRAEWGEAEKALGEARAALAGVEAGVDPEEVARVDHNLGVVALYRGKTAEAILAFERSLAAKRALGDRAGVRSSLLNLGLGLAKSGRLDEADRALDEALLLAQSLGQTAGRGWCLAAKANVAVRRRDAPGAERCIAAALALAAGLPAAIRADLAILRGQVALLEGDGRAALAAVAGIEPAARADDPLVDARAMVIEAGAHLATLPVDARRAARVAIAAVRTSRRATLPEAEAQALDALRAARATGAASRYPGAMAAPEMTAPPSPARDEAAWGWLAGLAAGRERGEAALELARMLVEGHGAERAFVLEVDAEGEVAEAYGVDLDRLSIGEAARRVPAAAVRSALGHEGPVYQREVETGGGRGARLAVASTAPPGGASRAVVVLEHRFVPGRFDRVTAAEAARWAVLAALLLRMDRAAAPLEPARGSRPDPFAAREDGGASAGAGHQEPRWPAAVPGPSLDHTTAFPVREPRRSFPGIVGTSPALRRALARLDAAIDGDLPVLIVGETGTGKELFARALHELGRRARQPMVTVNCGAIPDALFEAELFGHARGSFTGADRSRVGLLARAEKGTLFLDEIGELPLLRQAGLLRALEARRYRPVGSDEELPFDVRVVAATNRDLEQAVAERAFRQDLLFRLNTLEIRVPPLREREGDVLPLARAFLQRAGGATALGAGAAAALAAYGWPGNVRELEHTMQRLAALGVDEVDLPHLPRAMRTAASAEAPPGRARAARAEDGGAATATVSAARPRAVARAHDGPAANAAAPPARPRAAARGDERAADDERAEVTRALAATGGNISRAAGELGLTRHGLKKRMVRLGMRPLAGATEKAG